MFMYERARFNRRKQEDGESVNSFITDPHTLDEHGDFGALHDQLIRDRIVVGIMDSKLSEWLQLVTVRLGPHPRKSSYDSTPK